MMKKIVYLLVLFTIACGQPEEKQTTTEEKAPEPLKIVVTTNILGDMVTNIVKDKAQVTVLMGAGVDPHLYKATQNDIQSLMDADIIVYNGLHLEGKMGEVFEKVKGNKKVIAASDGIDPSLLINSSQFKGAQDPHIWFDATIWSTACEYVTQQIASEDSINAEKITSQGLSYANNLLAIDTWIKNKINELPEDKRILITAHDAFGYFGKAYNVQVKGLQGISTLSEYGLKDVTDMVDFIQKNKVKAVFVETSVNQKSMEAVIEGCQAKGYDLKIGANLYSDAMGEKGSLGGTYLGMIKYNVSSIVSALR
jgi:manganese/zinc/iron transport system substrate-binding protein